MSTIQYFLSPSDLDPFKDAFIIWIYSFFLFKWNLLYCFSFKPTTCFVSATTGTKGATRIITRAKKYELTTDALLCRELISKFSASEV